MDIEVRNLEEVQKFLESRVQMLQGPPAFAVMREATLLVQRSARAGKAMPVDTGRLRASITPEVTQMGGQTVGIVGSNVSYACIYGSHTRIITDAGHRTIGQIRVGDRVLTQTGEYRCVIAKTAFPVTDKPNMVDIEIAWRSDRTHKITVTEDHKVLVYRDGRNKWIMAGDLLPTDRLYSRKKMAHNKGTGKVRTCLNCGLKYRYDKGKHQGRMYCSQRCKNEHWHDKGNNPHIGMRRSPESRHNMSVAATLKLEEHPELHPSRIVAMRGNVTMPERQIRDWLDGAGFDFSVQEQIGSRLVDFYLPDTHTVIEADGSFWHQDQAKDIARDAEILDAAPEATVIHIHFADDKFTPPLDTNPLPGVYYVAVNPGIKSYTDPTQFETRPILSLKKWRYERPAGRAGAKVPKLYDLTIDGVHSFFANGILVSNSHQELGFKPHFVPAKYIGTWATRHGFKFTGLRVSGKARMFLQKAFTSNIKKIEALYEAFVDRIVRG